MYKGVQICKFPSTPLHPPGDLWRNPLVGRGAGGRMSGREAATSVVRPEGLTWGAKCFAGLFPLRYSSSPWPLVGAGCSGPEALSPLKPGTSSIKRMNGSCIRCFQIKKRKAYRSDSRDGPSWGRQQCATRRRGDAYGKRSPKEQEGINSGFRGRPVFSLGTESTPIMAESRLTWRSAFSAVTSIKMRKRRSPPPPRRNRHSTPCWPMRGFPWRRLDRRRGSCLASLKKAKRDRGSRIEFTRPSQVRRVKGSMAS